MNYTKYRRFGRTHYLYADCKDYLADSLFYKRKIPVRFKGEFHNPAKVYLVIHCTIKKKYENEFEEALKELYEKMDYYGWNDYAEFCEELEGRVFDGKSI